ncbi:GTP 3',8-cyclase MoaA [Casimicrobium huifangae]|uniref:GTP 3',8-cyclase MoaA n=1 Tax=Casimicrobium huifangae TaxID=2591109 RepID=UPI0037833D80
MGERSHVPGTVIPLTPVGKLRGASALPVAAGSLAELRAARRVADSRSRHLHDLRISVTDKCNFRCTYCMPKEVFGPGYKFLPHDALLSFEEITRFARIAAGLGVEKLRLTGGEPTLRRHLPTLIEMLAQLRTPAGKPLDLTLTTNGSTLVKQAAALKAAGLSRITVSLDSMDDAVFRAMNDVDFPVADVLRGIDAALAAGLAPVKVNMVVKRGVNDHTVVDMARHFRGTGVIVRFIEFMDVGSTNGWRMDDVMPSRDIVAAIHADAPLMAVDAQYEGEVAERWRYADGSGEIGVISSVTQAFCGACTRARLSTDGKIFTCLFADQGTDFRALLRGGASDDEIAALLAGVWQTRTDRYSEIRTAETASLRKVEMSYIGG